MQGYTFTEDVRHSLMRAREEAVDLGHTAIGPEHMLLGLLITLEAVVAGVLKAFRIDASEAWQEVRDRAKRGDAPTGGPDIPYTWSAKKALELTMWEARQLGHSYCGCGHLLLGIIEEGQSVGAEVLIERGITLDGARAEVLRLLGQDKVATGSGSEWLTELGTLTRQLSDSLGDVRNPRSPEDLLLVIVSDDGGARHILSVSGVDIDALKREIAKSGGGTIGGPTSLRELIQAAKSEQQFLGDCALASYHLLLAYLALRPAHGYRALSSRGVTHASVRAIAEKIFG